VRLATAARSVAWRRIRLIVNPAASALKSRPTSAASVTYVGTIPGGTIPTDYRPGELTLDEAFIPTMRRCVLSDGSSRRHHQEYLDWKPSLRMALPASSPHLPRPRETGHQARFVGVTAVSLP
jgi:hypothetical protein